MKNPIIFEKNTGKPFKLFEKFYKDAMEVNQKSIDAMVVSTAFKDIPSSRIVNLKYVLENKFIFFTNYNFHIFIFTFKILFESFFICIINY